MKKCTLWMPNPMAEYLQAHKMDAETELRSYCMMLYPLMRKGDITHKQIAHLLHVDEKLVNAVYDSYELPHQYARAKDFLAEDEKVAELFRNRKGKNAYVAG